MARKASFGFITVAAALFSILGPATGQADPSAPSTANGKVIRVLHDRTVHDINDPYRAAAKLRATATELGADIDLIPRYLDEETFGIAGKPTLRINLPSGFVDVSADDRTLLARVMSGSSSPGKSSQYSVIVLLDRPLTIRELAELMESGVRVLERIPGGLLVRASGDQVLRLDEAAYTGWVGEFLEDYKYSGDERSSSLGQYGLRYFGGFEESYRHDLESIGASVELVHEGLKRIVVNCDERTSREIAALAWIAGVYPAVAPVLDSHMR